MQGITDLRKATAAAAVRPLGLTTSYDRVFAKQVAELSQEARVVRQKYDTRYATPLQDMNPASGTFGQYSSAYPDPFNRGPI